MTDDEGHRVSMLINKPGHDVHLPHSVEFKRVRSKIDQPL